MIAGFSVPQKLSVYDSVKCVKDTFKDSTIYNSSDTLATYIFPEVVLKAVPEYDKTGKVIFPRDVMMNTPSFIVSDPLRSLALLPYVNVNDEVFPASVYIKGGRPEENSYFIEGFPVLFPFHFAFTTAIPINIISRYDFYTLDIPPEYSNTVSAAVNFYLRDKSFKELFVDPTSSLHYAFATGDNFLTSIRLTTFSFPLYLLENGKYFYGFGDFLHKSKQGSGFKNVIFFSYDRYKDAETDMIGGEYANFMAGLSSLNENIKLYFSGGYADSRDLLTLNSVFRYRKGIFGLIYRNRFLLPVVLHLKAIDTEMKAEDDSLLKKRVLNGYYGNIQIFLPIEIRNSVSITPGVNIYYLGCAFKVSPKLNLSYTLLNVKKSSFFRISSGISGQLETSSDYESGLKFVLKGKNVEKSLYVQAEYRTDNQTLGIFYRFYPDYYFFDQRVHVESDIDSVSNDTLYSIELADTIINAKKYVYGGYWSFQGFFGKYRYYGDLSYLYGNIIEASGIHYPVPFTSNISCRLLVSRSFGKFVLTFGAKFRSSIHEIRFYRESGSGKVYELYQPDIINLGPYFRLDMGANVPLVVFGKKSLLSFGIYNLIWKKPKTSEYIWDKFVRTPTPYLGLRIKL